MAAAAAAAAAVVVAVRAARVVAVGVGGSTLLKTMVSHHRSPRLARSRDTASFAATAYWQRIDRGVLPPDRGGRDGGGGGGGAQSSQLMDKANEQEIRYRDAE